MEGGEISCYRHRVARGDNLAAEARARGGYMQAPRTTRRRCAGGCGYGCDVALAARGLLHRAIRTVSAGSNRRLPTIGRHRLNTIERVRTQRPTSNIVEVEPPRHQHPTSNTNPNNQHPTCGASRRPRKYYQTRNSLIVMRARARALPLLLQAVAEQAVCSQEGKAAGPVPTWSVTEPSRRTSDLAGVRDMGRGRSLATPRNVSAENRMSKCVESRSTRNWAHVIRMNSNEGIDAMLEASARPLGARPFE